MHAWSAQNLLSRLKPCRIRVIVGSKRCVSRPKSCWKHGPVKTWGQNITWVLFWFRVSSSFVCCATTLKSKFFGICFNLLGIMQRCITNIFLFESQITVDCVFKTPSHFRVNVYAQLREAVGLDRVCKEQQSKQGKPFLKLIWLIVCQFRWWAVEETPKFHGKTGELCNGRRWIGELFAHAGAAISHKVS